MNDACLICGEPATLLCDFVLGFQIVATLPHPVMDDSAMWTCDAPLCATHAKHAGNRFFSGSKAVEGVESVDYCPVHRESSPLEAKPMFAADAAFLRRGIWSRLRRQSIHAVLPRRTK